MTMLGRAELERRLGYHPATAVTGPAFELNRALALVLADAWDQLLPPGREAACAQTALQEALIWANAAIACNAGPDWAPPAVDVVDLTENLLDAVHGPEHTRRGHTDARSVHELADDPTLDPETMRAIRGDCTARVPGGAILRCERVAGHEGQHVRGNTVWP